MVSRHFKLHIFFSIIKVINETEIATDKFLQLIFHYYFLPKDTHDLIGHYSYKGHRYSFRREAFT